MEFLIRRTSEPYITPTEKITIDTIAELMQFITNVNEEVIITTWERVPCLEIYDSYRE